MSTTPSPTPPPSPRSALLSETASRGTAFATTVHALVAEHLGGNRFDLSQTEERALVGAVAFVSLGADLPRFGPYHFPNGLPSLTEANSHAVAAFGRNVGFERGCLISAPLDEQVGSPSAGRVAWRKTYDGLELDAIGRRNTLVSLLAEYGGTPDAKTETPGLKAHVMLGRGLALEYFGVFNFGKRDGLPPLYDGLQLRAATELGKELRFQRLD